MPCPSNNPCFDLADAQLRGEEKKERTQSILLTYVILKYTFLRLRGRHPRSRVIYTAQHSTLTLVMPHANDRTDGKGPFAGNEAFQPLLVRTKEGELLSDHLV